MKKLWLFVSILVLALALVACGGPAETDAPETDPPETNAPETDPVESDPPETEHVHDLEVEEQPATCSERGYYIETCKTCGETVTERALPKAACTPSGEVTCTVDSVCTVCGKVLAAATGHAFGDKQTVLSTCTAEGKETATCTVCGTVEETVLPMIAHIMGTVDETKEATCTEAGYKKGTCIMCDGVVTEEIVAVHDYILSSFFTAEDGTLKAACHSCGDVAVTEDVRVALNFDTELESELASLENGDKLALVDSSVSSVYKKANAVITTNGDRTVLQPKRPVMIDFDGSLLSDASYYVVSFDYYVPQLLQPTDVSNPERGSVFAFVPGFHGGGKVTGGEFGNFTKFTFGKGFVFSQYGTLADIEKGVPMMEVVPEKWYTLTYVVDNTTGETYAYVDGECIGAIVTSKPEVFAVNEEAVEKHNGYFAMIFACDYTRKMGVQFDNFKISSIR